MSTMPSKRKLTQEEYLVIERASETRSEFYDGVMYAMSGASRWHGRIAVNLIAKLDAQLGESPCQVFNNDLRVDLAATGSYAYPDVVGVCGEPRFRDDADDTLLNPVLAIEVLSPSTESFDRGGKFARYRRISSLKEYVLVSQDRMMVERFRRHGDSGEWILTEFMQPDDLLEFESIGCAVSLREIYARVELPDEAEDHGIPDSSPR